VAADFSLENICWYDFLKKLSTKTFRAFQEVSFSSIVLSIQKIRHTLSESAIQPQPVVKVLMCIPNGNIIMMMMITIRSSKDNLHILHLFSSEDLVQ
jgi:hypothetical protein